MREIPKDIVDDVERITKELIVYKNKNNLSWTSAYKEILEKIGLSNMKEDNRLLANVVTKLTTMGYDIEALPFKLTKFY